LGHAFSSVFGFLGAVMLLMLAVSACNPFGRQGQAVPASLTPPSPFESNGQRIYWTATSSSGQPIESDGSGMMSSRIACVVCHGPDGKGGSRRIMMREFEAANITWPELMEDKYTEDTVKRAITDGLDQDGQPLQSPMPRWRMSASDLQDIVDFLKTLK
jgi:cytochrome c oxidase subunit 2